MSFPSHKVRSLVISTCDGVAVRTGAAWKCDFHQMVIIKTLSSVHKSFLSPGCLNAHTITQSCSMFDQTWVHHRAGWYRPGVLSTSERFPQSIKEYVKQVVCRGCEGHESGRQSVTKASWFLYARSHVGYQNIKLQINHSRGFQTCVHDPQRG